jgi:hypothetical protein
VPVAEGSGTRVAGKEVALVTRPGVGEAGASSTKETLSPATTGPQADISINPYTNISFLIMLFIELS